MTRSEALSKSRSLLPKSKRPNLHKFIASKSWGMAAGYVLEITGRADLSDAIWSGA